MAFFNHSGFDGRGSLAEEPPNTLGMPLVIYDVMLGLYRRQKRVVMSYARCYQAGDDSRCAHAHGGWQFVPQQNGRTVDT